MFNRDLYTPTFIRLIFSNLFFWMSVNYLVPVLPVHFHHQGYTTDTIGMIVGFFALGAVLFRIPSGRWVDRYGSVKVLGIGIFIAGLSLLLLLYSATLPTLLLARFIHGASITGFSAAALTINSVLHKPQYQNEAVGIFTLFIMIGNGIAFSSSLYLYLRFGFDFMVILSFIVALLTFILFPKNIKLTQTTKEVKKVPLTSVIKNPGVWIPSICQFGSNFAYGALFAFVPILFESVQASGLSHYYMAYAISVVLTRVLIGRILNWVPSVRLLGFLLYGFGITLAGMLLPPSPLSATLMGLFIGLTYGISFPALIPIVASHTGLKERGVAFGVFTTSVDIGSAFGSILLGILIQYLGFPPVFTLMALFLFALGMTYQNFLQKKLETTPEAHQ